MVNVGKYTSPMDGMGKGIPSQNHDQRHCHIVTWWTFPQRDWYPKNPDPIQTPPDLLVGLMVDLSYPQNRIIGEIPFLEHIWILRGKIFSETLPGSPMDIFGNPSPTCHM